MRAVLQYRLLSSLSTLKSARLLEAELAEELAAYREDPDYKTFLTSLNFSLQESEASPEVKLLKTQDDFNLEVTFKARLPHKRQHDDAYELEGSLVNYNQFQVLLMKTASPLQMMLDCSVVNSKYSVDGLYIAKDFSKVPRDQLGSYCCETYKGRPLKMLRPVRARQPLLKHITAYLRVLGVDDQLAIFIDSYSIDKESRLYLKWLSRVNEFFEGPSN
jgi:hypothetical protein